MEEGIFKLSRIILTKNRSFDDNSIADLHRIDEIRIGDNYTIVIICKYTGNVDGNEVEEWKQKIKDATVCVNIKQHHQHIHTELTLKNSQRTSEFIPCILCGSLLENCYEFSQSFKRQKKWFLDNETFVITLTVYVRTLCHCNDKAQLSVSLTSVVRCPLDHNVLNTEEDFKLHFREISSPSRKEFTHQKFFTEEVKISTPPCLLCRVVYAGAEYLIFIKVCNEGSRTFDIYDCSILCGVCQWTTHTEDLLHLKNSSACQFYGEELCLTGRESCKFPSSLSPGEEFVMVFKLSPTESTYQLKDIDFHAHLKWKSPGDNGSKVISSYRLVYICRMPSLKIRHVPFVLSAQCLNTDVINLGQSFSVIYSVVNKLQHFLSWKLYWSTDYSINFRDNDDNTQHEMEYLRRSVVCNDPVINFGDFARGKSCSKVVNFQVLRHGLFELGKHMKLNLSYAVNSNKEDEESLKSPQSETTSLISSDKYLAASEELWRDRIGSTSSLGRDALSAAGRRESFATKSYSFGDLGPELSLDSDDADKNRFKDKVLNSPLQTPVEEMYKIPTSNFKKNSFQLYV